MPGVEGSVGAYRVPCRKAPGGRPRAAPAPGVRCGRGRVHATDGREVAAAFERDPRRDVPLRRNRDELSTSNLWTSGEVGEDGERERPPPRVGTPRPKDDCEFEGDGHLGGEHRRDGRVLDGNSASSPTTS